MTAGKREPRHYPVARVLEVHDGDTVKLDVDLGFSVHTHAWVRLKGVRAPELSEAGGPEARSVVWLWLDGHAPDGYVAVNTFWMPAQATEINEERSFIRYLGVIISPDGTDLNGYLQAKGYTDQGR